MLVDGNVSECFDVTTGVLQGDVPVPYGSTILTDYLLKRAVAGTDCGIVTHPRASRRHCHQIGVPKSAVFCWLRNKRSGKRFFNTQLGI